MPRLLRDIIDDAIAREPDMMLIDEAGGDFEALVHRSAADVAIVVDDSPDREAVHRQMLVDHPELKILVVTDDGRTAQLLELRRRLMSDVSAQSLVRAIRDAAGAR
jgi:DNA-binding NarL/FixJ family response regulator